MNFKLLFECVLDSFVKRDKIFLERQKHILQLFSRVLQHEHLHPEYARIGKNYSILDNADCYTVSSILDYLLF